MPKRNSEELIEMKNTAHKRGLSARAGVISPSPTLAITSKANQMRAEGIDVIGFGAGEPDFDTPQTVKDAAKKALDAGFTKYTPTSGIKELKEAVRVKFKNDNGLDYGHDQILVSCGAKHSLFNAILTLCDPGDEVIVPSPYWVSYLEMIKIAGAEPVIIDTDENNGFKITPDALKKAFTSKTKLFILNSPSNPTGMVYTPSEIKALSEAAADAGIWCISDEIYEKLIYDGAVHVSPASFGEAQKNMTIVVNGVSKAYSMTGWRIGYAAGPKEVIQAMSNLQDHSTSNPTSIAQKAAVEALTGPQNELARMASEFKKRRDYMVSRVNAIKGLHVNTPQGAFYCFVNVKGLKGAQCGKEAVSDSLKLTELLLTKARVAVVPGCVFGDDDFIRLSYATSLKNIEEGLNRIEQFAAALRQA